MKSMHFKNRIRIIIWRVLVHYIDWLLITDYFVSLLLLKQKDPENKMNKYNQNYRGVYCTCQRPYPDLEDEVENTDDFWLICSMQRLTVVPEIIYKHCMTVSLFAVIITEVFVCSSESSLYFTKYHQLTIWNIDWNSVVP